METQREKREIEHMKRLRDYKRCKIHLTIEELAKMWPNLPDNRHEHLNYCSDCQQLVDDLFPVLYTGPVSSIVYKEKSSNKTSDFILEELKGRFSFKCRRIWDGNLFLESLTNRDLNHIQGCKHCRKFVDYISRSGGVFATDFGSLHQNLVKLVEMNWELAELRNVCRQGGLYIEDPYVKNCWDNCLNPVDIGRDRVILIPRHPDQTEHHKNCVHCQLVLQYHQFWRRSMSFRGECFDTKTWSLFPVYSQENQADLEEHIFGCHFCSPTIVNRLKINFQRDQQSFQKLLAKLASTRDIQSFIRGTRRPIGDFISSWRFHFGGDGPFATKHPWSVWGLEDRIAKLVRADGLSDKEILYRRALMGETTPDELCDSFAGMIKPNDNELVAR